MVSSSMRELHIASMPLVKCANSELMRADKGSAREQEVLIADTIGFERQGVAVGLRNHGALIFLSADGFHTAP